MIFYDKHKQRKYFVRIGIVLLLGAFVALTVDTAFGIRNSGAREAVNPSVVYYGYDNYYSNAENEKKIALTFDDGPHPVYTKRIVDILKEENVPATFFFMGSKVVRNKDVVAYVDNAGFEIGNHTFTHSEGVHSSQERLLWELSVTNALIEDITDKPTLLYRPPFLLDVGTHPTASPYAPQDDPLAWSMEEGYVPIGADLDPKDWSTHNPILIVERLEAELSENPEGRIVLLHDGGVGSSRRATVDALPILIERLREEGYTFTTVSELLGFTPDNLSPESQYTASGFTALNNIFLSSVLSVDSMLGMLFAVVLTLVFFRALIFIVLYIIKRTKNNVDLGNFSGLVSVVIPAYNEAENIESTIESIVTNDYQQKEIIVVDDGSTDKTAEVVLAVAERFPDQIRLIQVQNGGKAHALSIGFQRARGEVVVALDGDTIFAPQTISKLTRHFNDKSVGAVAGKIMVGNTKGLLAAFQSIEYITGQNIERNVLSAIGAVSVVPGAAGAWRKSAVIDSGGLETNTLVEDQDLTLSVLRGGWRVKYEPKAIAYTEVPHNTRDFMRQRFRWVFGTMQCFWKYRRHFLNARKPQLGLVILPNTLVYNVLVPLLSPAIDILVIFGFIFGFSQYIIGAIIFFTLFDSTYSFIAFASEPGKRRLLWFLPIQRLYYRLVIYFIVLKGIVVAIEGTRVGWSKVEKRGVAGLFYNQEFAKEYTAPSQTKQVPEAV